MLNLLLIEVLESQRHRVEDAHARVFREPEFPTLGQSRRKLREIAGDHLRDLMFVGPLPWAKGLPHLGASTRVS